MAAIGFFNEKKSRAIGARDKKEFPERAVQYLRTYTNYSRPSQLKKIAARYGLAASFDYTTMLYAAKMRQTLNQPPLYRYKEHSHFDAAFMRIAAYVSGITLVLRPIAGEKSDAV